MSAHQQLPETLQSFVFDDQLREAVETFKDVNCTFVISRGFGFPIAQEAALKFKETAGIQAEAFSSAEIMHGPFALIRKDQPFLLFAQSDETLEDILNLSHRIQNLGGKTVLMIPKNLIQKHEQKEIATLTIPLPKSLLSILDPIVAIYVFYILVAKLAIARGYNPDQPKHLQKITETL